jgi:hypothetical protein
MEVLKPSGERRANCQKQIEELRRSLSLVAPRIVAMVLGEYKVADYRVLGVPAWPGWAVASPHKLDDRPEGE